MSRPYNHSNNHCKSNQLPLPDEFSDFVTRYFKLLASVSVSIMDTNPDTTKCISLLGKLEEINSQMDEMSEGIECAESEDNENESGIFSDENKTSMEINQLIPLAMYLQWLKSNQN